MKSKPTRQTPTPRYRVMVERCGPDDTWVIYRDKLPQFVGWIASKRLARRICRALNTSVSKKGQ